MNEQENTKLVQRTYELFKSGDIETLLSIYSDDIVWQLPDMENVPFGGKRTGRENVVEFFSLVNDSLEDLQIEPTEFIAQGDKVVVLGHHSWRVKATGREVSSDFAHVVTVKDGKVTSFHEFMDTADVSRAHTAAQAA